MPKSDGFGLRTCARKLSAGSEEPATPRGGWELVGAGGAGFELTVGGGLNRHGDFMRQAASNNGEVFSQQTPSITQIGNSDENR